MTNTTLLSGEAKHYLCCYYQILDEMVQGVTTAPLTASISHNFISQLIPHHRAAVRMCRNILAVSEDQAVRRLALRVIDQQTQDIDQLETILTPCAQSADPQPDLRLYQRRTDLIFRELFSQMGAAPESGRLNAVFLRELLPHHQGAVRLAENALKYDVCQELVPVLQTMVTRHCRELGQMRALLRRMGCQTR